MRNVPRTPLLLCSLFLLGALGCDGTTNGGPLPPLPDGGVIPLPTGAATDLRQPSADLATQDLAAADASTPGSCQPEAERCDGKDNDCNGVVDDLSALTCGIGACQRMAFACIDGKPRSCTPGLPAQERCDRIDDDCDGVVDNGIAPVVCGTGACRRTMPGCSQGIPVQCVPGAPGPELCNGVDDNCNGLVDDGLGSNVCGIGQCRRITPVCSGGRLQQCTPGTPVAETCNGVDDNCNGQVDENLGSIGCGVGQCYRSVPACVGGAANRCVPGVPAAEVCNGLDDNCNGQVDEGAICEGYITLSPSIRNFPLTLVQGDAEFRGHGPDVSVSLGVATAANGTSLIITACTTMTETVADWTTGQACSTVTMQVPGGRRVTSILSPTFRAAYRDTSTASPDNVRALASSWVVTDTVAAVSCIGDTPNGDVCNNLAWNTYECSGCDFTLSRVHVRYAP